MLKLTLKHRCKYGLITLPAKKIPLPINILGYGFEEKRDHDYAWDGMKRGNSPFAIWQYTLSGEGSVALEGQEYRLLPGMAMMVEIPQPHYYCLPERSDRWEFIWVNLVGTEAMLIWRVLTSRTGPAVTLPLDSKAVDRAIRIIKMRDREKLLNPYENSTVAHQFLMQLVQELLPSPSQEGEPDTLQKVMAYCVNHMHEPLGVEDLAAEAGYSRYHFNRLFKEYQGITPMAFLTQVRMNHALQLLQTTRLNIKEIAHRCGFEDPSYFCKVFRKTYKVSPQRFRTHGGVNTWDDGPANG